MSTATNAATASQQGGFRRLWRALRQLFHEAIAAVFAVLALGWFNAALRAWTRDVARWLIGLAIAIALLFAFFAVTSFRRARKLEGPNAAGVTLSVCPVQEGVHFMADTKTKSASPAERKEKFTTLSGLPVDRLYTEENLAGWDAESALGYPGEFPFTRGIYPTMYRGRFWTMRQYAGFGTAIESNQRYRYLLSKGQAGLSVAFDLPTQIGMDSDHSLALGEVGKVGVAIDSLEDMEMLFDGIPLEKVSTSMTINATAAILLCLYVAVAKRQGASLQKLSGTV